MKALVATMFDDTNQYMDIELFAENASIDDVLFHYAKGKLALGKTSTRRGINGLFFSDGTSVEVVYQDIYDIQERRPNAKALH